MTANQLSSGAFRLLRMLSVLDVASRFSERETAELLEGGYAERIDGKLVITPKGEELKRTVQARPRPVVP
jgi:hypothetical protein